MLAMPLGAEREEGTKAEDAEYATHDAEYATYSSVYAIEKSVRGTHRFVHATHGFVHAHFFGAHGIDNLLGRAIDNEYLCIVKNNINPLII